MPPLHYQQRDVAIQALSSAGGGGFKPCMFSWEPLPLVPFGDGDVAWRLLTQSSWTWIPPSQANTHLASLNFRTERHEALGTSSTGDILDRLDDT